MNRTIISKVALKYDDNAVLTQPLLCELQPTADILTDAQAIAAFFQEVVRLTDSISTAFYMAVQGSAITDYPKADTNHENTIHYSYKQSIGCIDAIGSELNIRMLNIVDGIEQATGMAVDDYTTKKIALEIYRLTAEQMQTELAVIQQSVPFEVHTPIESLYDLLKPFVPLDIPMLDNIGYAKAVDDNSKIVLYANAMQYTIVMA